MTLWKGLLSAFDRDLWDMPYRIVLNKLRMGTSQLVGTLPPVTVREIMEVLFPTGTGKFDLRPSLVRWDDSLAVAGDEISAACAKINAGKASGPDGIMGQIIKNTSGILTDLWMSCFKACLREGVFPAAWKMARLVLIKKPGKPDLASSSYRPICLLSEASKLLERVVCDRVVCHLDASGGISDAQYGFRPQRSKVDAIWRLRSIVDDETRDEGVVLIVSIVPLLLELDPKASSLPTKVGSGLSRILQKRSTNPTHPPRAEVGVFLG